MALSCPVCYEQFVADESHTHCARKLHCGDVICKDCITSEIAGNNYYCPECGREYNNVTDIDSISDFVPNLSILENANTPSPSGEGLVRLDSNSLSPNDSFSRENKRISLSRLPCSEPGCKNKAIAAGLCMYHASAGANLSPSTKAVAQESRIAKNMAANSDLSDIFMLRGQFESRNKQTSIHPDDIIRRFKNQQRIELGEAMEILNTARNILSKEPNILRIDAPVIAVGDIHGQFYDLLNLLEEGGKPSENSKPYLFLGDYVDRGHFSCEVLFTLLALKIAYPDKIFLLRGNHESGSVSSHFGFKQECKLKYGVNVYHRALLVFQTMPIASIISTAFGDIYACHGGLSPTLQTLEQIDAIDRFVEPEMNSGLLDILWSDPINENDIDDIQDEEYEEFLQVSWKPNPARGCSYCFGYNAVKEFLNKNSLVCIVRAHEVQAEGFRRHFEPKLVENRLRSLLMTRVSELADQDDSSLGINTPMKRRPSMAEAWTATEAVLKTEMITEKDFPPVITIFSAPNYCDRYGNKAAILHIDSALDGFRVIQYDCVEHPVPDITDSQTENYIDAIVVACPYMPSSFREFVKLALQLGPDESLVGELENLHLIKKNSESSADGERPYIIPALDDEEDAPLPKIPVEEIVISRPPEPVIESPTPSKMAKRKSLTINIVGDAMNLDVDLHLQSGRKSLRNETFKAALDDDSERYPQRDSQSSRKNDLFSPTNRKSGTPKKSFVDNYMQALASDSINEVHPEALTNFIQGTRSQKNFHGEDKAIQFQFPQKETATVSVMEIRKRFERVHSGSVFSEFQNWRENEAEKYVMREAAKRVANAKIVSNATRAERTATITDLDKCQRFDEIMAKFGGSSKKTKILAVDLLESLDGGKNRRKSTGSTHPDEYKDPDSSAVSKNMSDATSNGDYNVHEKPKTPKNRRASSFDPKLANMVNEVMKSNGDEEYKGNRTPFFVDTKPPSPHEESAATRAIEQSEKEIVFSPTEILALRLMFSMYDRSGSATIEYEDLVAYAQETDDMAGIHDADVALDILDIDGDGKIGLLDFIHFAGRLKKIHLAKEDIPPSVV